MVEVGILRDRRMKHVKRIISFLLKLSKNVLYRLIKHIIYQNVLTLEDRSKKNIEELDEDIAFNV